MSVQRRRRGQFLRKRRSGEADWRVKACLSQSEGSVAMQNRPESRVSEGFGLCQGMFEREKVERHERAFLLGACVGVMREELPCLEKQPTGKFKICVALAGRCRPEEVLRCRGEKQDVGLSVCGVLAEIRLRREGGEVF